MSLLNALGASPMLSLIGWTVVSAFTLGAAAAALVLLCRSVAPRLTAAWQHRVVLALYALSLAAAFAIAAVPRIPAPAAALSQPVFGLPVAGAVIPAPPGPSALTTNSSRVDLRVAVEEAVGVLAVLVARIRSPGSRAALCRALDGGTTEAQRGAYRRRGRPGDGRLARRPDADSPSYRTAGIRGGGYGDDWRLAAAVRAAPAGHGGDARLRYRARARPRARACSPSRFRDRSTSGVRRCRNQVEPRSSVAVRGGGPPARAGM